MVGGVSVLRGVVTVDSWGRGTAAKEDTIWHSRDMAVPRRVEEYLFDVRPMEKSEVRFAASEHLACFPEGFFARLGARFLRGYYRSFLDSEDACALVAVADDQPVGYLTGMTSPTRHRAHVLRVHRARLVLLGLSALSVRPLLMAEFMRLRARRYWKKVFTPDGSLESSAVPGTSVPSGRGRAGGTERRSAILSHVIVTARFRERGVGEALITEFVRRAGRAGCEQVLLVTESGGPATRFYRHRCWSPVGERRTHEGRSLTTYSYPTLLPTPPSVAESLGGDFGLE